jgi:hypothetical protein
MAQCVAMLIDPRGDTCAMLHQVTAPPATFEQQAWPHASPMNAA